MPEQSEQFPGGCTPEFCAKPAVTQQTENSTEEEIRIINTAMQELNSAFQFAMREKRNENK